MFICLHCWKYLSFTVASVLASALWQLFCVLYGCPLKCSVLSSSVLKLLIHCVPHSWSLVIKYDLPFNFIHYYWKFSLSSWNCLWSEALYNKFQGAGKTSNRWKSFLRTKKCASNYFYNCFHYHSNVVPQQSSLQAWRDIIYLHGFSWTLEDPSTVFFLVESQSVSRGEGKFHLYGIFWCFFFVGVSISSLKHFIKGHGYMHALILLYNYSWHKYVKMYWKKVEGDKTMRGTAYITDRSSRELGYDCRLWNAVRSIRRC